MKQITGLGHDDQPTLIFLHEGLGCSGMWKDFPTQLCKATQLNGLLYDRQGHGYSSPIFEKRNKDYLHIEALDFLPNILNQLNIKKSILIGHSDGGTIALIYAAHYSPQAIITEAAHIYVEDITITGIRNAVQAYKTTSLREKLSKYHGEKTDALFHAWSDTWLAPSFHDWNIQHLLPKIKVPSLIIQGEKDPYATQQHWQDIITDIGPHAHPIWLKSCGHSPHKESPSHLLKIMKTFIETH